MDARHEVGHDESRFRGYYCAALRRCSTSCFAGRGSVLKLRAQIASLRFAQGSRILIIMIDIDCNGVFGTSPSNAAHLRSRFPTGNGSFLTIGFD